MKPTFRKLAVKDIGSLERLVAENADSLEPGLKVIDSRLLLGQAEVNLVGLDAQSSLVLIALDLTADHGLLLRVMDAYSWCLEYPDTLRRLYPMAQASSRPPRILFIAERMTDAFLRRMKQLSFLEIDCFEFRHLEVNGVSVVYFDLVEQLRRSPVVESAVEAPVPATRAPAVDVSVEPRAQDRVEPKKLVIERPAHVESRGRVSEPKAADPPRIFAAPPVRLEPAAAVVAAPPAAPLAAVAGAPAPVAEQKPRAVVEVQTSPFGEYQSVKLEAAAAPPALQPAVVMAAKPALALESIESTSRPATNGRAPEPAVAPVVEAAPSVAARVEEPVAAPAVAAAPPVAVAPEPAPAPVRPIGHAPAPVQASPVKAKPGSHPTGVRPHGTKSTTPVEAPAMVPGKAATAEPATQPAARKVGLEADERPELESLSFPRDGLSRQWLEFLSQLGATK